MKRFTLGALAVGLAAMTSPIWAGECSGDADCLEPQVCHEGQCVEVVDEAAEPCRADADCPEPRVCHEGQCVDAAAEATGPCRADADCPQDYICEQGQCFAPIAEEHAIACAATVDCPGDHYCDAGYCVSSVAEEPEDGEPGWVSRPPPETDEELTSGDVLAVVGGVLFLIGYSPGILIMALADEDEGVDDKAAEEGLWPLVIPLAGPFATYGTAEPNAAGGVALGLSAAGQLAGLTMFICGLAMDAPEVDPEPPSVVVLPTGPGGPGLTLTGWF